MNNYRKVTPYKWHRQNQLKRQDSRDREQAERALAESEERYRSLVELSPEAIVVHCEGKLVYINPTGARQLGLDRPEQALGLSIKDLLPPESFQLNLDMMDQVAQGKAVPPLEQAILRPDGSITYVEIIGGPVLFQGKLAFQLIVRDISEQKRIRQAVQESEHHLRALIEEAPLGLHQYELCSDGRLIFTGANPAANRILGFDHQRLIGMAIEDAFPSHRQSEIPAIYKQVAIDGKAYFCEQIAYQNQQIEGIFEINAFQTGPSHMAVFFQDVTEKRRAEVALKESEEKFRALIEQNSEGVVLYDELGRVIEWNAAQERSTGITREEALGRPVWELQYQATPEEWKTQALLDTMREKSLQLLQTGQSETFYRPFEALIQGPEGNQIFIQQTAFPIKTKIGFRIGSVMRDITERKQAELNLQRRMVELEALRAVALAGTEATSTVDLLDRVAKIIRENLYPDHFGVAFLDERTQELAYHPSFLHNECLIIDKVPPGRGISGAVVRSGKARRVADVTLDPDYMIGNSKTRAELCVPLMIGSRVIGVVNLENAVPDSFSEADERLVTAIASELGTALEKIRLLEAEQNRRRELEALEQISAVLRTEEDREDVLRAALERVMTVMNLQGAGIVLRDPHSKAWAAELSLGTWAAVNEIYLPEVEEISQKVALSQHYYLNNTVQQDTGLLLPGEIDLPRCFLCLALIVDSQTHGLLYLGRDSEFLHADIHLSIAMADVLASRLHGLELHEQTQRQLERLTALRAIDQSILSHLTLEETLDVLLEKVTGLLQVDAANFLLYQPLTQKLTRAAGRGLKAEFIWDASIPLKDTCAGRVVLSRQMMLIADLSQIENGLTEKLRKIGETFVSYLAVPLIARGELKGVLQLFVRSRLELTQDWKNFMEALADQAAIAINSAQLYAEQQQNNVRLTEAYEATIDGWSRVVDRKDQETEGHSKRVSDLTLKLARRMHIPEEQLVHIRRGAQLHDIGKMGVPDEILQKKGPLDDKEWEIMRQHPTYADELLSPIEFLAPAREIPLRHHEKWDGTGYPDELRGEDIPLSARIFAVIDVWDALTHNRWYREAWPKERALAYIREQSGRHFDPRAVQEFLAMVEDIV